MEIIACQMPLHRLFYPMPQFTINHEHKAVKDRKQPTRLAKETKLKQQHNRCFYCGNLFDEWFTKNKFAVKRTIVWDHVSPYSYTKNNTNDNFVAACKECNAIKAAKLFDSFEGAAEHIRARREQKGYPNYPEWGNRLIKRVFENDMFAKASHIPDRENFSSMSDAQLQETIERCKWLRKKV